MEIKEIVNYYVDSTSNILEVSFRTIEDNEDVLRTSQIEYTIPIDYGYFLENESFDFFSDDDFENLDKDEIELDEDMLISFLNEYYTINPELLPKSEFF